MSVNAPRIIRSKRRTLALIVERDGSVTVRAPLKISARQIQEFVEQHSAWVEKKQAEMRSMRAEEPLQYKPGERLLYLGQSYLLMIVPDTGRRLVLADAFQLDESLQAKARDEVQSWYRQQARRILAERVAYFAGEHQIEVGRVRITSARTRWGSCSPTGDLSFTWRLMMTPPEVIDYVVVHELAHIRHHDHSVRFWKLVEQWMPDYRARRKQLRRYAGLTM